MRQRDGIASLDDLYQLEAGPHVADYIAGELQISGQRARQLHLHMLIYTIGLGTIFSITTPGISADEIFAQQDAAYEAFLKQVLDEEEDCEAE